MANVVVQAAAATPNVVKVVQAGIAASNVVQSTETRGTITINTDERIITIVFPTGYIYAE